MAITLATPTLARVETGKTQFMVSFYSADASGAEVIKAAHATKPYYITELMIASDVDGVFQFGDGEDSSAVETVALQFISTATGLVHPPMSFKDNPIKLTAAKAITIDGTAGPVSGYVVGYTVN